MFDLCWIIKSAPHNINIISYSEEQHFDPIQITVYNKSNIRMFEKKSTNLNVFFWWAIKNEMALVRFVPKYQSHPSYQGNANVVQVSERYFLLV